jgi:hypothetical protein
MQNGEHPRPILGNALILMSIFGERLAGIRDVLASRSAGILPALANEERKARTLAAILSHPIGRWASRPHQPGFQPSKWLPMENHGRCPWLG